MGIILKSKAEKAGKHAGRASNLFEKTHNKLDKAVKLYEASEIEHGDAANAHLDAADYAREQKAKHIRFRNRIAEFAEL